MIMFEKFRYRNCRQQQKSDSSREWENGKKNLIPRMSKKTTVRSVLQCNVNKSPG